MLEKVFCTSRAQLTWYPTYRASGPSICVFNPTDLGRPNTDRRPGCTVGYHASRTLLALKIFSLFCVPWHSLIPNQFRQEVTILKTFTSVCVCKNSHQMHFEIFLETKTGNRKQKLYVLDNTQVLMFLWY